jgi:exopolysaccharide production repressor protein
MLGKLCTVNDVTGLTMSFLLFLRGYVGALLAFSIMTYVVTGSLRTTFVQTVICAVLIQIGYFAGVVFLVWRRRRKAQARNSEAPQSFSEKAPPVARS